VALPQKACEYCGEEFVPRQARSRFCPEPRRCRKQYFEQAHRAECEGCGGPMGQGSGRVDGSARPKIKCGLCAACIRVRRAEAAMEMLHLRQSERLGNRAIAERIGRPVQSVAQELSRLRALGFDVPVAKHGRAATGGTSCYQADTLGASLVSIGVDIPGPSARSVA
jgi:hypothetical protein